MKLKSNSFVFATLVVVTVFSHTASAVKIWKAGNDGNINLTTSWWTTETGTTNPGSIGSTDALQFGGSGQGSNRTISLGGNLTIGGIKLDNGTGSPNYNVIINAGNTLTLNGASTTDIGYTGGGIVLNSGTGGTLTINADIIVGANQQWVTSRNLTVGGAIDLGANTLSFNTAGTGIQALNGVISGTGALNKTVGSGTLTLGHTDNTFNGTVTLAGGTTTITKLANGGNNSSLGKGSSAIVLNGAILTYLGNTTDTTDRAIDMRANTVINNNGTGGQISFTAANVIQGGTAAARTLTLGGSNGNANSLGSIIGDSGTGANITTLTKSGQGTWVLTKANTYTGSTVINQGILRITGTGVLGGAAGSTVDANNIWFTSSNANGTIEFETNANLGAADQIRFRNTGGTAGAGGNLKYIGTTAQVVSKAIQCDTSVGIRLSSDSVGGSVEFSGSWSNVTSSRPIFLGGTGIGDNKISGNIASNGAGTLTKVDGGKWILSGNNSYTGGTSINAGTLQIDHANALGTSGTIAFGGGTLLYGSGITADLSSRFSSAASQAYNIDTNGNDVTFATGLNSTSGTLTKSGGGTLTIGTSSYTGVTNVNGGKLLINGNVSTNVSVNTGATLGGSGVVNQISVLSGATLSPGNSIGTLTGNAITLAGISEFEINTAGDISDLAIATGLLTFGGTLNVTNIGGTLLNGDIFNLFDWGSTTGTFSSVTLPSLSSGLAWDQSNLYSLGTIAVVPEANVMTLLGSLGTLALLRRRR